MARGGTYSDVASRGTSQEGQLAPLKQIKTDSPFIPNYGFVQHHNINVPAENAGFYDLLHSLGQKEFNEYLRIEQKKQVSDATLELAAFFNKYKNDYRFITPDGSGYVDNFYEPYNNKVEEISKSLPGKTSEYFKAHAAQARQAFVNSLFDIEQAHRLVHTRDSQMSSIGAAQQMMFVDSSMYPVAINQIRMALGVIEPTMSPGEFSKFKSQQLDTAYSQMVLGRIHEEMATTPKDSIILAELKARKQEWVKGLQASTYTTLVGKVESKITANALLAAKKERLNLEMNYLQDSEQAQAAKHAIAQDMQLLNLQPLYSYVENLSITTKQVMTDLKKFYGKQLKMHDTIINDYKEVNQLIVENKGLLGVKPGQQENYLRYRLQKEFTNDKGEIDVVRMANETSTLGALRDSPIIENVVMAHVNSPNLVKKYDGLVAANIYMNSPAALGKKMSEEVKMAAVKFKYAGIAPEEVKAGTPAALKAMGEIDAVLSGSIAQNLKELPKAFKEKNTQDRHLEIIDAATKISINRSAQSIWDKDWYAHEYRGRTNPRLIALAKKAYEVGYVESGDPKLAQQYAEETVANSIKVSNFNGQPEIFLGGPLVDKKGDPNFEENLRKHIYAHIERLQKGGLEISRDGNTVEYLGSKYRIIVRNAADFKNRLNVGLVDETIQYDAKNFIPIPYKADGSGVLFIEPR
jgi:hypothetical protein